MAKATSNRSWWDRLMCALGVRQSPVKRALDAEIERGKTKRRDSVNTQQMQRVDRWRASGAMALLVCVALGVSGCAAVKAALPELLATYGIPALGDLIDDAKARGKVAIDEARAKAEAIPDQLDRIEALAEITRAEQAYQTGILEELAAALLQPREWDTPPPVEPAPEPTDEAIASQRSATHRRQRSYKSWLAARSRTLCAPRAL
jgi:hypothetical protein